jgi:hypothetical protein
MKSFSRVAIATLTMVGFVGFASAQPKADPKATPAPAKADAKAAPAPAKVDAKAPAKADPKAAPAPAKAEMPMPKVPQEVVDMAKAKAGTWKCTGNMYDQTGTPTPMTATLKSKADLDGFWLHDSFEVKMAKYKYKFESFMTYDAASKKWRSVMVDNSGSQSIGTSDGMKDNKMDMNLDMIGPMGAGMFRDHVDASDAKAGVKMSGEASMDKGKNWMKVYEQVCKK